MLLSQRFNIKYIAFLFCVLNYLISPAQDSTSFESIKESHFNKKKIICVAATEATLYPGSLIGLNELWYKDYPRSAFHSFNDNNEWLQMDKVGHAVTAYNVGLIGIHLLKWTDINDKKALWYGGLLGFVYLGSIEVLDGFSQEWGFSWGDFTANALGSITLIGQELLWKEQRISLKFSAHQSNYANYRPEVLGENFSQQLLKDYNGQTYWMSVNVASFIKKENKFPKWLNLTVGYGADGMTGGSSNPAYIDGNGVPVYFDRYRQYYLSLDIDFSRIKTKSIFLKTIFKTINFIKIPAPTLEFNKHEAKGHWIYF